MQILLNVFRRQREVLLGVFLFVAALHLGLNVFSQLRFDEEKIEIWALPEQTQVTGFYHYANRSILPVSFSLGIPFPVDSEHPWPAEFHLSEVDGPGTFLRDIETRTYRGETVFRLWFWPGQQRWIRLDYVQGTSAPHARYILASTRKWHRPLERGDYLLHLGSGLELASSNYSMICNTDTGLPNCSFSRSEFLPASDWEFAWRASSLPDAATKGKL